MQVSVVLHNSKLRLKLFPDAHSKVIAFLKVRYFLDGRERSLLIAVLNQLDLFIIAHLMQVTFYSLCQSL